MASTMVTSGTMTNRIDQLEKAGLAARQPSPDDRRSFRISLTKKGFRVIDAAVTAHIQAQQNWYRACPKTNAANSTRC